MKRILTLIVLASFCLPLLAQEMERKLSLSSDSWQDTLVFLAVYKGNSIVVLDTFEMDVNGKSKIKASFHSGKYALISPDREQFPFILNEKKLNLSFYQNELEAKNSLENSLYFYYRRIQDNIYQKRQKLRQEKLDQRQKIETSLNIDEIQRTLFLTKSSKLLDKTLVGKLIRSECIPNDLSYYQDHPELLPWLKERYFKYMNLAEPHWLYNDLIHSRIKFYLTKVINSSPESIIAELTDVIEKSKTAPSTYKFLLDFWIGHYQRSKDPGSELVFKYLATEYYLKGQTPWIEDYKIERLKGQINLLQHQYLGDTFLNLVLKDTEENEFSLSDKRNNYQFVIFWDPNCAHCKVEVPSYYEVYLKYKSKGFSIVAIYKDLMLDDWTNFIQEKGLKWINAVPKPHGSLFNGDFVVSETPSVFLLDASGKIIKKRIHAEELDRVLSELYQKK